MDESTYYSKYDRFFIDKKDEAITKAFKKFLKVWS